VVNQPDVLLSLTANWPGAGRVLAAGLRGVFLSVHGGVAFRGDLWGNRGDEPDGVLVKGIGDGSRLVSAVGLDGHSPGTGDQKREISRAVRSGRRGLYPGEQPAAEIGS
jgi:hypothetical protein